MSFSSTVFLFAFLPVVLLIYQVTPARGRNLFLLLVSFFFYTWGETWFALIMLASITVDYFAALWIADSLGRPRSGEVSLLPVGGPRSLSQKLGLLFSLTANLSILGFFKYFHFTADSFHAIALGLGFAGERWQTTWQIALPLGISFFTFQSMSYTIDVYLGNVRATRRFLDFATYVSLFPQLVAGPIVRYRDIAADLYRRRTTADDFAYGVRRFALGLSKKVLIADAFAFPADRIFALPAAELTPGLAWLGVASYTIQIYFDFSGYSDMAIGLGRMFGFRFLENFNYPYVSRSVTDFWRRWHISLSSWFRDYVYIPAGGNRKGRLRTFLNLWLVFFLCGLWHGASWNFVIWGLFHGTLLVIERVLRPHLGRLASPWKFLGHVYLLLAVMVGWVLFRADTLSHGWALLCAMVGWAPGSGVEYYPSLYFDSELWLVASAAVVGSCPVVPYVKSRFDAVRVASSLRLLPWIERGAAVSILGLLLLSLVKLSSTTHHPFIYFRF